MIERPNRVTSSGLPACLRAAVALVFVAVCVAPAAAQRVIDWRAGNGAPAQGAGWIMERFGNVREASVQHSGERGAAVARFASADGKAPPASLRFPVPFRALHVYRITLEVSSPETADVDVMIRRRAAPYEPMAIRSVTLGSQWQTLTLEATWPAKAAEGDVRVQLRGTEGNVAVRRLEVDDLGPAPLGNLPVAAFAPTLIGLHVNKLGQHDTWPAAGQRLMRLWDTYTTWSRLSPNGPEELESSTTEGWKRLELYVNYARRNQPDAVILYTLGMPPAWASGNPEVKCSYGPGACAAPASIDVWRRYVRAVAQRYKGRIRHWELWNEADHRSFYLPTLPLAELAKAAQEELRAVDPGNKLLGPAFTAFVGMNALHRFLEEGGGRYVDVIAFHWYFDGRPEQLARLDPERPADHEVARHR